MSRTHVRGTEPVKIAPREHLPGRLHSDAETDTGREVLSYSSASGWSATRLEWTLADLAIMDAGAVTVPLYDTSSPDQRHHILDDAEPALAVVSDADLADRLGEAGDTDTQATPFRHRRALRRRDRVDLQMTPRSTPHAGQLAGPP